jgi:hypothetical protein
MATISNTPRPGYAWDSTDNVWYPIGTGTHSHSDYITAASAINPTIVDAKGDIIAATAADTVARLAVGTDGQVLTAASGQTTGLQWATPSSGGMTLLSTTTLSGATTTISSISASYNRLVVYIYGVTNATAVGAFRCAPNNNPSTTQSEIYQGNALVGQTNDYVYLSAKTTSLGAPDIADAVNFWTMTIDNYAAATSAKSFQVYGGFANGYGQYGFASVGRIILSAAISSLVFSNSGGNLSTGTVLIYGVK